MCMLFLFFRPIPIIVVSLAMKFSLHENILPLKMSQSMVCVFIYVTGSEKRGNFAQKLPPLKGTKSHRLYSWFIGTPALLLKKSNIRKCSYVLTWNGGAPKFRPRAVLAIATPIPEMGGARIFQRVWINDWGITIPGFKTVAITALKICAIKNKNSATARNWPFCQIK